MHTSRGKYCERVMEKCDGEQQRTMFLLKRDEEMLTCDMQQSSSVLTDLTQNIHTHALEA